ncbi:MAG: hypothetical protein ACETWK_02920 [Candidatus Aminicenantaceae bacterium]
MKRFRKIQLSPIIVASSVLWLFTGLAAAPVDPGMQFLEAWNASNKPVEIATRALGETSVLRVPPKERLRFPDVLEPCFQSMLLMIGNKRVETDSFSVNNFANKTWLRGKLLTIWPDEKLSIEKVLFLDGMWRIIRVDDRRVLHEYKLDISHTEPHFTGYITYMNTRQEAPISGTMKDQIMNFKIASPANLPAEDMRPELSELRVYPDGRMEGYFNASYVEDGKREKISAPIRFEADFKKKQLVFKGYEN